MAVLQPCVAILAETGVTQDPDFVGVLRRALEELRGVRPEMGVLVLTEDSDLPAALGADTVAQFAAGRLDRAGEQASSDPSQAR